MIVETLTFFALSAPAFMTVALYFWITLDGCWDPSEEE